MIEHWTLKVANNSLVTAIGEVTDLELPTIVREFDTDRRVGYAGSVPTPTGFGEMNLSFTVTGVTETFYNVLGSLGELSFLFTGIESKNGFMHTHAVAAFGFVENLPVGTFDASSSEYEVTAKISSVELKINNQQVVLFSPKAYTYKVGGVDQMLAIRTALGI